ncbi:uncharacterized protein Tco025E_01344 [Trypanosoma conorhini]|uniref:F-box domain-containing protein n=1 Tax=Trypanosoma conorhini TaxID=83891 RepID=A0A3R7NSX7_9TRYP|nr:uncharacterized protein Tco025E_01344 [Trypanosoma conorhini]RNF26574.1 hypothetical protein Tco025E_01344 [Trypanosoma conorhini]
MSGVRDHTNTAPDHFDINSPPRRLPHKAPFVDDDEEVEFVSYTLGAPTTGSAPVKRNGTMKLCSMVPEDETESETSSSLESSGDDGGACVYHAAAAGVANSTSASSSSGGGGNGLPQQEIGTGSTTSCLGTSSPWKTELTLSGEERAVCSTEVIEGGGDSAEKKQGKSSHMCKLAIENADTFTTTDGTPRLWKSDCFFCILCFCDCDTVCRVMLLCSEFYKLATHDKVWKNIIRSMNLQPLLALPKTPTQGYYRYFLDDIITTRALHGQYSFRANTAEAQLAAAEPTRGGDGMKVAMPQYLPCFGEISKYHIHTATLICSPASLGQMNHPIGRVQLLIEYIDKSKEMIEGVARFSWHRKCFVFCCSSPESGIRGQVFTVAISSVEKPWCNQSMEQFGAHKGGLRFVMAPVLLEGAIPGSKITEMDLVSVSCPPTTRQGTAWT